MFSKKDFLIRLMVMAGFLAIGVWQSASHAAWTQITIPRTTQITKVAVADSFLFASTDSGVFQSNSNGATWQKATGMTSFEKIEGNSLNLFAKSSSSVSLYSSQDHGFSWNTVKTIDSSIYTFISDFAVQNNKILYIRTNRSFFSENNGQSWSILNTVLGFVEICCHIIENILFLGGPQGIYSSPNLGHAWYESNYGILSPNVKIISSKAGRLYIGSDMQTGVYCSIDSGYTWKSMGLQKSICDFAFSKTTVFAGTDSGVYAAQLDSTKWTDISMSLNSRVQSLATDTGYLYAATTSNISPFTNSLYRRSLSEVNAQLKKQVAGPQPLTSNNFVIDHFLSQHALGITFNPGRAEKASLRVYSATGKNVATIFDGIAQDGANKYFWDYKTMPTGIYCISLQSENGKAVKMVQVMK